jgi:hypothetical protein
MQSEPCPYEKAVLKACRSGEWDRDLLKHYENCPICHEAERTAEWVRAAAVDVAAAPLPDPDLLWIRAKLGTREQEESRALWLATFHKTLAISPFCAAAVALILEAMKTAGIPGGRWLLVLTGNFGVIALAGATLMAALVYTAPSLLARFRAVRLF